MKLLKKEITIKENPVTLDLALAFQIIIILTIILSPLMVFGGTMDSAFSQRADDSIEDPSEANIPSFDFNITNKSIVVVLEFTNQTEVQFVSANVTFGLAPTHIGDPPLLRVEVFDSSNRTMQEFNAWHPLWNFVYDSDPAGTESLVILRSATGAFIFPFHPNASSMLVTDLTQERRQLISVDLKPAIQEFCQQHPDDSDCIELVTGPIAGSNNITAVLFANPESYNGSCPAHIEFNGSIADSVGNRDIAYRFIRSDGATLQDQIVHFGASGSQTIFTNWELGDVNLLPTYNGWVAIEILSPVNIQSNHAEFEINCTS